MFVAGLLSVTSPHSHVRLGCYCLMLSSYAHFITSADATVLGCATYCHTHVYNINRVYSSVGRVVDPPIHYPVVSAAEML